MKRLAIGLAVMTVSGALPASVGADLPDPGPNGRIAFTSGRDTATAVLDNTVAQIWLVTGFGNPGSATRFTSSIFDTSHHRHPSWSPDHTKIAYARGPDDDNFNGPWSIVVHDVLLGSSTTIANASNVQDRPAWSPDGTEIAYARDTNDADATASWVVETRPATGGAPTTVATGVDTAVSSQYTRPHWTPSGNFILYGKADGGDAHDIYLAPANGSVPAGTVVVNGVTDDYQPHVSPAGDQICFTRDVAGDKDVFVATMTGASADSLATGASLDYECAWSPDTTKILFSRGAFGAGALMMRNSDATGVVSTVADAASPAFDGNGDWATNFSPTCQNATANASFNGFATIPLSCTDAEDEGVEREIVANPTKGNLGAINNDDTVIYTPNANFTGTDTFTFKGNDQTSDSNTATITVNVAGPGGGANGKDATAARIERVRLSPRTWRRGTKLPAVSRAAVGTTISFRLSEKARVTLTFARKAAGRRVGRRCVKPTRRNRTRRRCTRYVRAGTLRVDGKAGTNRVKFQGRLSRRKRLALGRYRLTVGATDGAGNKSRTSRPVAFRIVRR